MLSKNIGVLYFRLNISVAQARLSDIPLSHYYIYKKDYFQMNWKLHMLSLCINVMIPSFLIITDLYLFFPLYQRYLKELCITG